MVYLTNYFSDIFYSNDTLDEVYAILPYKFYFKPRISPESQNTFTQVNFKKAEI